MDYLTVGIVVSIVLILIGVAIWYFVVSPTPSGTPVVPLQPPDSGPKLNLYMDKEVFFIKIDNPNGFLTQIPIPVYPNMPLDWDYTSSRQLVRKESQIIPMFDIGKGFGLGQIQEAAQEGLFPPATTDGLYNPSNIAMFSIENIDISQNPANYHIDIPSPALYNMMFKQGPGISHYFGTQSIVPYNNPDITPSTNPSNTPWGATGLANPKTLIIPIFGIKPDQLYKNDTRYIFESILVANSFISRDTSLKLEILPWNSTGWSKYPSLPGKMGTLGMELISISNKLAPDGTSPLKDSVLGTLTSTNPTLDMLTYSFNRGANMLGHIVYNDANQDTLYAWIGASPFGVNVQYPTTHPRRQLGDYQTAATAAALDIFPSNWPAGPPSQLTGPLPYVTEVYSSTPPTITHRMFWGSKPKKATWITDWIKPQWTIWAQTNFEILSFNVNWSMYDYKH